MLLFLIALLFPAPCGRLKEAFAPPETFVRVERFAPFAELEPKDRQPGFAAAPRAFSAPWLACTAVFGRATLFDPPNEERFRTFELELPGRGTLLLPANPRLFDPLLLNPRTPLCVPVERLSR